LIRNVVAACADNPLDQPIPFVAGLQSSSENLSPSPFHAAGEFSVGAHRRARTDRDIHIAAEWSEFAGENSAFNPEIRAGRSAGYPREERWACTPARGDLPFNCHRHCG